MYVQADLTLHSLKNETLITDGRIRVNGFITLKTWNVVRYMTMKITSIIPGVSLHLLGNSSTPCFSNVGMISSYVGHSLKAVIQVYIFNPFLHIYTHFDTRKKKALGKHCGKR